MLLARYDVAVSLVLISDRRLCTQVSRDPPKSLPILVAQRLVTDSYNAALIAIA